jgi:hypothetical protein
MIKLMMRANCSMKFYDLLDLGVYKDAELIGQLRFAMQLAVATG